ncbi:MAG: hypothetical protein ACK5ES_24830, partial [Planctomyces sp.]
WHYDCRLSLRERNFNSSQSEGRRTPPRAATVSTIAGYPNGTHAADPLQSQSAASLPAASM